MKTEMKVPNECLYPTDVFLISCGMGCKRITVTDIAYIEAMKDNCVIHMIDGKRYTQSCPMGTRFVAGESTEGNMQYYSLAEKAYVLLSCTNINIYPYMIRDYLLICAIIIAIPPAITKIPIVKKNQKNHWA